MIYRKYHGTVHSYKEGCHIARDLLLRRCACVCVEGGCCIAPNTFVGVVSEYIRKKLYNIDKFREVTKSMAQTPS